MTLTHGQRKFMDRLSAKTGLSRRVIAAWILQEENGGAARSRENEHQYNWLNVGWTDKGRLGFTYNKEWNDPVSAADATAAFMKGQKYGASQEIRNILKHRGNPEAVMKAITQSGWASSGYEGLQTFHQIYRQLSHIAHHRGGGSFPTPGQSHRPRSVDEQAALGQAIAAFDAGGAAPAKPRGDLQAALAFMQGKTDAVGLLGGGAQAATPDPADQGVQTALQTLAAIPQGTGSARASAARRPPDGGGEVDGLVGRLKQRADTIDRKHLPYLWGGGHGGKVIPRKATPLDCSGAVSAVLGINPLVSGDLAKWGRPGRGKRVTIYANGTHTFMEIDGHFFGTSHSNPGGGAGWIPRSQISKDYLRGFTARHPRGG